MKKLLGMVLILTMVMAMFAGCSSDDGDSSDSSSDSSSSSSSSSSSDLKDDKEDTEGGEKERETIVLHLHNFMNDASTANGLEEIQKMDKFAHVDFVIKDKDQEYDTTLPIAIAGGEQIDVVALFNPIQQNQFAKAGIVQNLEPLIAELGVDMAAEYGDYAENAKFDGNTVMFPHQVTKWVLYYNKSIFDNAGIPYPDDTVPMTWTEYSQLAADLTSGEGGEKIYGALHLDWPMFWYGEAIMKLGGGENFYTADGLSNIEDPIFAKALERTYNMQHADTSIPTHADIIMSKTGPQAFMGGQYGMIAQGAWLLSWAADSETYPRDWELGIAPMPVDEGTTRKTWGVVNGYAVAQTSANPVLAAEVALELSRLDSKLTETAPAASTYYPSDLLFVGIAEDLSAEGITLEVIHHHFNDSSVKFVTEKVTGPNNVEYETVLKEEVEKYFVQEQDLETTIKNIKERGDKAITD